MLLDQITIYPVKSLRGIQLREARITDRGLEHDRRYVLVDESGRFISQRSHPLMALFGVKMTESGFEIDHPQSGTILLPFSIPEGEKTKVTVWDDTIDGLEAPLDFHQYFSGALGMNLRLIYMPNNSMRAVDQKYGSPGDIQAFTDGYPFLTIGQASLDDLNSKLEEPVTMERFRPNFVIRTERPFDEDSFGQFQIGGARFEAVKPCSRCVLITVDPATGIKGQEPLRTLAGYRSLDNKVMFGQNCVYRGGEDLVRVGDVIHTSFL